MGNCSYRVATPTPNCDSTEMFKTTSCSVDDLTAELQLIFFSLCHKFALTA